MEGTPEDRLDGWLVGRLRHRGPNNSGRFSPEIHSAETPAISGPNSYSPNRTGTICAPAANGDARRAVRSDRVELQQLVDHRRPSASSSSGGIRPRQESVSKVLRLASSMRVSMASGGR